MSTVSAGIEFGKKIHSLFFESKQVYDASSFGKLYREYVQLDPYSKQEDKKTSEEYTADTQNDSPFRNWWRERRNDLLEMANKQVLRESYIFNRRRIQSMLISFPFSSISSSGIYL